MGIYDARSDDKSVEPESVVVTKMGDKTILFVVGLEELMRLWCMMFRILLLQNFLQTLKRVMRLRAYFYSSFESPTKV
jgi:hypothetical protein